MLLKQNCTVQYGPIRFDSLNLVVKYGKDITIAAPTLSIKMLPSGPSVIFKESTYFSHNGPGASLPSPAEVRARQRPLQYGPVRFDSLGLIVKYGKEITIAEGQCLWYLRWAFPLSQVPVPEVYGWCEDEGEVFIYMELVKGVTLEERWEALVEEERGSVCGQLRDIVLALRSLKQDPDDKFLGKKTLSHLNPSPESQTNSLTRSYQPPTPP
jgi:hypothetical protein